MFHSLRTPHLALRIALGIVFLWFGVDKFIDPTYWIQAWVPDAFESMLMAVGMSAQNFIILNGIFEVLVAVSLVSGYFIRIFSSIALVFLVVVVGVHITGPTEIIIRDIGLIGGLLALALWPERTSLADY